MWEKLYFLIEKTLPEAQRIQSIESVTGRILSAETFCNHTCNYYTMKRNIHQFKIDDLQAEPGPGGWRSEGGRQFFFQEARRDLSHSIGVARSMGRPRHLHIIWRRPRAAQWTPTKDWIYLRYIFIVGFYFGLVDGKTNFGDEMNASTLLLSLSSTFVVFLFLVFVSAWWGTVWFESARQKVNKLFRYSLWQQ